MRVLFILPVFLPLLAASCALPGRQSLAPSPVAASPASIAIANAFNKRIPLVTIQPATTNFTAPLAGAVRQALAIKPSARFEVQASTATSNVDAATSQLQALAGTAAKVANAIMADGVAADHVTLTAASTPGTSTAILVFVK